jgi:hypothetical protein
MRQITSFISKSMAVLAFAMAALPIASFAATSNTTLVSVPYDASNVIVTGGTSQVLSSANGGRQGFSVQNQSAGALWVNDIGGTASGAPPSWQIPAGTTFTTTANYGPTATISIWGATTGQAFTARVW